MRKNRKLIHSNLPKLRLRMIKYLFKKRKFRNKFHSKANLLKSSHNYNKYLLLAKNQASILIHNTQIL